MSKGLLEGLGGSGGSAYMAQRFYAARDERDCGRIAMLWTVLFAARWPMVLGFAILAMDIGMTVDSAQAAEGVLSGVLQSHHFPAGVRGLILAAMLAAAMSTFDSTLNAGTSYVVRDLYQPFFADASERRLVILGYLASAVLVALGLVLSLWLGSSILGVWVGIEMLLFPAFLVPFALRWYWSRFNGEGFTLGVLGGFVAAVYFWAVNPTGWNEATQFLGIAGVSAVFAVGGTYLFPAVPRAALEAFYEQIRPWGVWPRVWRLRYHSEPRADLKRLGQAVLWQICTFLLPMTLVLGMWIQAACLALLWVPMGISLWRSNEKMSATG